ncbi:hypothetical protein [Streptomyces sp. KL116D]|uniref:hypothetical protein n=1 Tax=Streptomyces sp. KL116D TaxID=3045152 RepID=UPI0035560726
MASLSEPGEAAARGCAGRAGCSVRRRTIPALRAVWYRVNQESEEQLLPVVTRLAPPGTDELGLRLTAARGDRRDRVSP